MALVASSRLSTRPTGYSIALGLTVSRRLATYIGLDQLRDELAATDDGAVLDEQQGKRLRETSSQLRQTAIAESSGIFAYVTGEKRLDVTKLLDEPQSLLPGDVYRRLSPMAQLDLAEAFKCIAYERSTAAAFHLMRAVEESLRRLYSAAVGKSSSKPVMWKAMTDELAKQPSPPPVNLLAQLDHIRTSFRNPTQHPDAAYDIDEAQDLAFVSIDILARLARALPEGHADASSPAQRSDR